MLERPDGYVNAVDGGAGLQVDERLRDRLGAMLIDLEADLPTLEAVVTELRAMVRDDHERSTDRRDPRSERSEALENVVVVDADSTRLGDDWMAGEFDIA